MPAMIETQTASTTGAVARRQPTPIESASRTTLESAYHPRFDLLRFVAASGVFLAHSPAGAYLPAMAGNFFVQVFFSLSGFLIGGLLLRGGSRDLPKFFFNRCLRIWIPYALAIVLMLIVCMARGQAMNAKFREFVFYKATFVYNLFGTPQLARFVSAMPQAGTWNHFWSICVEEQFYLVAPLALRLLPPSLRLTPFVAAIVGGFLLPHDYAAVAAGVLLAASEARWDAWYADRRIRIALVAVAVAGTVALLHGSLAYQRWAWLPAVGIVASVAGNGRRIATWAWMGAISYPFYLNHWAGLFLCKRLAGISGSPVLVPTVVAFVSSAALALGHYAAIERPVLARRSRWYSHVRGRACALAGFSLLGVGLSYALLIHHLF